MYVFTILAALLAAAVSAAVETSDLKPELEALLNTTIGGLLAMLGVIVNYEFGASKTREAAPIPPGTTVDTTTVVASKTIPAASVAEPSDAKGIAP